MMKEVFRAEGFRLMGAAFAVYNELGYGMAEEIYQESLEHELHLQGIPFTAKPEIRCEYKGHQLNKRYIPDLVVSGRLVVELKAAAALASEHEAQLLNYLRISRRPVGYLLNYGHKDTLEWKRLILSEFVSASA